ncbi:MAG: 7-carboxy-7-deazaguanine synthase QueE [Pseudonocardiaceae bacterium]
MTSVVRERPLLVAETFGPTLQGEGPSCGRQALFVRLSRCNLSCPRCDTPYTWDWQRFDVGAETHRLTAADILDWALGYPTELLVVTGGEPLLQQDLLVPLVTALAAAGRRVEVETNGTIVPAAALVGAVAGFNVSPKLASFAAPGDARRRINPEALQALVATGRAVFKFVASSVADLDEIADLERQFDLRPVWVMPEGTSTERLLEVMRALADEVVGRGWHLSTRLHVMLWGDARGR